jgi:hypothetical protein
MVGSCAQSKRSSICHHFASVGIADAAQIIERRPSDRHIRIGTRHLSIEVA